MGFILEKIEEAIKELLIGWIESNMTNMFTDVNDKVGTIAAEVGKTPSSWDSSIYQMIRGLSENVIVPIAGIIITFVLCYELISMITEKNNLHDMDTWMFFKWFFKAAVAIYLVTNTFDIVMAVFDIGQNAGERLSERIFGGKDLVIVFAEQLAVGFRHVFNLLIIAFRNFVAHVAEMFGHNQHVVAVDFRRNHFLTLSIGVGGGFADVI
mgnify:CR=1 FL=1